MSSIIFKTIVLPKDEEILRRHHAHRKEVRWWVKDKFPGYPCSVRGLSGTLDRVVALKCGRAETTEILSDIPKPGDRLIQNGEALKVLRTIMGEDDTYFIEVKSDSKLEELIRRGWRQS